MYLQRAENVKGDYSYVRKQLYKTLLEDGMFDYTAPQYAGPFEKIDDCDLEKLYIKETAFTRFNEEVYCGI